MSDASAWAIEATASTYNPSAMQSVSPADVRAAATRIAPYVRRTPVLPSLPAGRHLGRAAREQGSPRQRGKSESWVRRAEDKGRTSCDTAAERRTTLKTPEPKNYTTLPAA